MTTSKKEVAKRKRIERIGRAIKKAGIAHLSREYGITTWAIYKWRDQGYVPPERLEKFCALTGVLASDICHPDIRALVG